METNEMKSPLQADKKSGALIIERVFNLPVEKVWQAWTDPESSKKWWGPKDFTCPHSFLDVQVGGKFLNCMRSADGNEFWSTGEYKEIIPFKKLVCTDSFSNENGDIVNASEMGVPGDWPSELLVTVTFEEIEGKTKMTMKHEGVPPEIREECGKSWQESFDKLEKNMQ